MMAIVMEPIPVLRSPPRLEPGLARALGAAERAIGRAARRIAAGASGSLDLPALAAWIRSAPLAAAGEIAVLAFAAAVFLGAWVIC